MNENKQRFDVWLFRLNVLIVGVIFLFLAPTIHIIASWAPDKKNILWIFPIATILICAFFWTVMRLSIPALIRWGVFKDRRQYQREDKTSAAVRFLRVVFPILTFVVQMALLVFMSICVISYLRADKFEIFNNIP